MEFAEEYSVQTSSETGSLLASERLVRSHQAEIQRAAYLLSGEPHAARWFTRRVFLAYFERALGDGESADQRERLVVTLATDFLETLRTGEHPPPPPHTPLADDEPTRFAVEDQRSRVMEALDRLDPKVRATLVLREFNALPEETLCRTLDLSPYDLRDGLDPARGRIRDAAGVAEGAPVQPLLAQAAIGEPVTDIWPDLDDSVRQLYDRQATRRRRLVAGAGLATALVLVAGTVWLFGLNPFSPNETESQELAPVVTRALAAPTNSNPPSPPLTPTPEVTNPDNPTGNVSDQLLMLFDVGESQTDTAEGERETRQALYDPATGNLQMLDTNVGALYPSPDGKWLLYREFPQNPAEQEQRLNLLAAINVTTGERAWSREFPYFSNLTMVGNGIYAINWDESPSLLAIDVATGEVLVERKDLFEDLQFDPSNEASYEFMLLASPDRSQLLVAINRRVRGGEAHGQVMATYALPGLELLVINSWEYDEPHGRVVYAFPSYMAKFTPDGDALYAPDGNSVQFLAFGESEPVRLEIPFHPPGEYGAVDVRPVTSNDGRYLYVLALARMEVAVVDLLTRSVDLVVPFDQGPFTLLPDRDERVSDGRIASAGGVLSPDGRRMYLLGGWVDPRQPVEEEQSSIWVIDVETWRVTDRLVIPGWPGEVMWTHGGDWLIVRSRLSEAMNSVTGFAGFTIFEAATGKVLPGFDPDHFPEWSDDVYAMTIEQDYRYTYGRRPAIEGVPPETVETVSTLPRLEVTPEHTVVPSGGAVKLDLRILDPTTGQPLSQSTSGIRFDPSVNPMLVLRQRESGAELILVPSRVGPGRYSGIAPVSQEGPWDVEVRFGTGEGDLAGVNLAAVFNVTPSITTDSGDLYTLRVQAEPGSPAESAEWTIRARFINVETGRALPEDVELETGLPDELTVTFEHELYSFFTVDLTETRHGVYEGTTHFRGPGSWKSSISFRTELPRTTTMTIPAGTVVVGDEEK